ncbi:hypothetical protein AB0F77_40965 [Streptomyces sp. NPDC026672]|uniref:Rv1733c family protein n=1 Tax=unclassified Streptomyces TaxID=2593676 RepID=UPI0033F2BDFA
MPLKAFRGPKVWLWRWRRNPLKRRADTVEAWVLLGAWAATVLAGVFTGLAADGTVERGLARERAEWRPVVARLAERAPGASEPHARTVNGERVWATARWTVTDGSAHTGQVRVAAGSAAGTPVTVWTDPVGRLVTRPTSPDQAGFRAALIGALVGASAATVPFVIGVAVRGRLERRRLNRWDKEWARLGPQWRRMTW